MVVPFKRWHYGWLEMDTAVTESELIQMEQQNSWTAVVDGSIVACAGTIVMWPGRHSAWAFMTAATAKHMRFITSAVLKNIEGLKGRIEMTVQADFPAGHRWAKILGFRVEAPLLRAYGPDGADHVGYVRFQ